MDAIYVSIYLSPLMLVELSCILNLAHHVLSSAGTKNCLVPINGLDDSDIFAAEASYITIDWIMDYLTGRRINNIPIICILDCCRSEIAMKDRGRGNLSDFQGDATNTFIMYATSSNSTSSDGGDGANGTFTELLLNHIDKDAEITAVSMAIRNDLRERSRGKQVGALFFIERYKIFACLH